MFCHYCKSDFDPVIKDVPPHKSAYCSRCGKWLKHVRQQPDDDFTFFIGKYKGRNIKSMLTDPIERSYLVWAYDKMTTLKDSQRKILERWLHL